MEFSKVFLARVGFVIKLVKLGLGLVCQFERLAIDPTVGK